MREHLATAPCAHQGFWVSWFTWSLEGLVSQLRMPFQDRDALLLI